MPELIMMQGLPGSGKSYLAKEMAAKDPSYTIVEKDEIRAALQEQGWVWSQNAEEKDVIPVRDLSISAALERGDSVISSDTNFGRKHKNALSALAQKYKVSFRTLRVDTPIDVCLKRNAARSAGRVPDEAIWGMYRKYIQSDPDRWPLSAKNTIEIIPYVPTAKGKPAIICDLDGTLALMGDRSPYDASHCDELDRINIAVWATILHMSEHGYQIVYCSGRELKDRAPTERFLYKYDCPKGPLFMRPTGDHRKDAVVKMEIFNNHIRADYNILFVLDDRDQVVKMWRSLGLTCFQVAEGAF